MSTIAGTLITGAAGFIGSHLAAAMLARGEHVVGIDNFDPFYARELKERNVARLRGAAPAGALGFAEADAGDAGRLRSILAAHRPRAIVHLAAKAGVRPSIEDPVGYARANVLATQIVLDEARRAGVERVVIASSSSVYGNNSKVPFSEEDGVSRPISPYAATKRACELIAHAHHHLTGMPTACLRFFTVYGPGQRPDLAIAKFLSLVSAGRPLPLFGDGSSSRDYTYIDDIVAGVLAALDRIDRHGFRIWNLGGSAPVTLSELVRTIGRVTGIEPAIQRLPAQPGDAERTFADLSRSGAELGFHPAVRLEDGIRRQWESVRAPAQASAKS